MSHLDQHIRELANACDQGRANLAADLQHLQAIAQPIDQGYALAQTLRPYFKYGLPLLGFLFGRKKKKKRGRTLSLIKLAFKGLSLWRAFRRATQ